MPSFRHDVSPARRCIDIKCRMKGEREDWMDNLYLKLQKKLKDNGKSVHQYGTRQAGKEDIFLPQQNTSQYGLRSIRYYGAKCWNGIPVEVKRSPSVNMFRQKLKIFLFEHNY